MSALGRHSASVRLWLRHDGRLIRLSQIGPEGVIPSERVTLSPTLFSEVIAEVDEVVRHWDVRILSEVDGFAEEIRVEYLPSGGVAAPREEVFADDRPRPFAPTTTVGDQADKGFERVFPWLKSDGRVDATQSEFARFA